MSKHTSFRFDDDTVEMLDDLARSARRSRAQVVALLIEAAWSFKSPKSLAGGGKLLDAIDTGLAARGSHARQRRTR